MLSKYEVLYLVMVKSFVLICEKTEASKPLKYRNIDIPSELASEIIECTFIIFDQDNNMVKISRELTDINLIVSVVNLVPMKMILDLAKSLDP